MAKRKKYDVLSPDGFSINRDKVYTSIKGAKKAFNEWKDRFLQQGYYSSNSGRIDLDMLECYCTIVEL